MSWLDTFKGKCKNCKGRRYIVKMVFKFFPIIQRCPECKGVGAIQHDIDPVRGEVNIRYPIPKYRLQGIEKSILH